MTFRVLSLGILALSFGWGSASVVVAQDVKPAPEKAAEVPVLDDIKLTAQHAALPFLSGENPFVLRESSWSGSLDPGKARLIQVQLFLRNEYHFWFAVPDRKAGLNLNVYNGAGEMVKTENLTYDGTNVVSLIVRPEETGIYYLRISLQTSIETPQKWSVIYAYR